MIKVGGIVFDNFEEYPVGVIPESWEKAPLLHYGRPQETEFVAIDGELKAGVPEAYGVGAALVKEFRGVPLSIKVTTKLVTADPKVSNYASIVYGYKDYNNHCEAQIHYHTTRKIYMIFRIVENGSELTFPAWPGKDTGLIWDFLKPITFSVNFLRNQHVMTFSNQILRLSYEVPEGRVGVGSTRPFDLRFDNFRAIMNPIRKIKPKVLTLLPTTPLETAIEV